MRFTVFGLGEAGSLIAAGLVAAGQDVRAYDPADVTTPAGVERCDDPHAAVADAAVVLALTASADAPTALRQALDEIPGSAIYADLSTSSAVAKRQLAELAAARDLAFADVALMSIVLGNGLRTPALTSGTGAAALEAVMAPLGMPIEAIGEQAGDAATRKLLRSVVIKGLAGTADRIDARRRSGRVRRRDVAEPRRSVHRRRWDVPPPDGRRNRSRTRCAGCTRWRRRPSCSPTSASIP